VQLDASAEVRYGCPSHRWISNTRWWKRTPWPVPQMQPAQPCGPVMFLHCRVSFSFICYGLLLSIASSYFVKIQGCWAS